MSLAVFQSIGPLELLIVLGIVLLIFGPKRLPSLGRQLGAGMREFKASITSRHGEDDDDDENERDDDTSADTRRQASAALGRPEGETKTSSSDGVVSEKR
jgi:sec-independent protein translocase protein TatA